MTLQDLARTGQRPAHASARSLDLMERLKSATAVLHEEAQSLVPLLSPGLTLEIYAAHLRHLYGLYMPLERRLREAARLLCDLKGNDPLQLARRAVKAEWLKADLLELGDSPETIAQLALDSASWHLGERTELIGTLYVFEGSTLGAQVVRRLLKERLSLPEERMHFYAGYGRDTGPMWNAFRSTSRELILPHEFPRTVEAARRAFLHISDWLKRAPAGPWA